MEDAMCCSLFALLVVAPRLGLVVWWLFPGGRNAFNAAFQTLIWPILGVIFLPWTTIAWTIFGANNGVAGFDWVWIGLGLVLDIVTYTSGVYKRKSIPGYPGSAP
jgi:hypothetical protein